MLGDNPGDKAIYHYSSDNPVVTREPEHDYDDQWAWRFEASRCDETCYHPVHGFGTPKGTAHLGWFRPGTSELIPLEQVAAT